MKAPKHRSTRKSPEDGIVDRIDLAKNCGKDLGQFMEIIQKKGFVGDIKAHSEAGTLARGILLKMSALRAQGEFENKEFEEFEKILGKFAAQFSSLFEKKQIQVGFDGDAPPTFTLVIKGFDEEANGEQPSH